MKQWIFGIALLGMAGTALEAAEMRTWMSRQGGTLEAELGSVDDKLVTLVTPEAREVKLQVSDLSLADRQHLVEFGGADESIITSGSPGNPEKDVRLESRGFVRGEGKMMLGQESSTSYEMLETDHFIIAYAGDIRPKGFAESAERLWHGMAFEHMNFRKDWGDTKQLILVVEDRTAHEDLGNYTLKYLAAAGAQEASQRVAKTWNEVGSTQIGIDDVSIEKYKIKPAALVFNVTDASSYKRAMSPFAVHTIAGLLLEKQMGGVSKYGSEGYFALTTGHAYYKEIAIAGKSETSLLDVTGSDNEVSSKSGFKDGSSWARSLRSLVKRDKAQLDLEQTLKWSSTGLTPEQLVTIYALSYYMESDSKRLAAYAKMIRRIESSNQIPEPIEIARIFGFQSVDEFNQDWKEFVLEGAFR